MRWSWLRAAVGGLVMGSAATGADAVVMEPPEAERASGEIEPADQIVMGLGFRVWDESDPESADWAQNLRWAAREALELDGWKRIASRSASRPPVLLDDADLDVVARLEDVFEPNTTPLGLLLCLLPSLDRTWVVSSLATSPDEHTRRTVARALGAPFDAVGVRWAIELLERDPSAEVRSSVRGALASRGLVSGRRVGAVA